MKSQKNKKKKSLNPKKKSKTSVLSKCRSALRKIWLYSELRKNALARARKARGMYQCEKCYTFCTRHEIEADHVIPATQPEGLRSLRDLGEFAERLLGVPLEGIMCLCVQCHSAKTIEDNKLRKIVKDAIKLSFNE